MEGAIEVGEMEGGPHSDEDTRHVSRKEGRI